MSTLSFLRRLSDSSPSEGGGGGSSSNSSLQSLELNSRRASVISVTVSNATFTSLDGSNNNNSSSSSNSGWLSSRENSATFSSIASSPAHPGQLPQQQEQQQSQEQEIQHVRQHYGIPEEPHHIPLTSTESRSEYKPSLVQICHLFLTIISGQYQFSSTLEIGDEEEVVVVVEEEENKSEMKANVEETANYLPTKSTLYGPSNVEAAQQELNRLNLTKLYGDFQSYFALVSTYNSSLPPIDFSKIAESRTDSSVEDLESVANSLSTEQLVHIYQEAHYFRHYLKKSHKLSWPPELSIYYHAQHWSSSPLLEIHQLQQLYRQLDRLLQDLSRLVIKSQNNEEV